MLCAAVTSFLRIFRTLFPGFAALKLAILAALVMSFCSCTLLTHSPYMVQRTQVPVLKDRQALAVSPSGRIPYQRWRMSSWDDDLRYVWLVGDYDFRHSDSVEIILYFHGMHSKDYYTSFRKELELLTAKRPNRPFLFVGLVDTPYVFAEDRSKGRWSTLAPPHGERPDRLIETVNGIFKSLRTRFPHIRKDLTSLTLAGFSGGGRVLDSVAAWLSKSGKDDPYAEVFRAHLTKLAYFDCWFGKKVAETVPLLLQENPGMKIVGTVHMDTPRKNALILANKFKMRANTKKRELVGLNGRLVIYANDSHWQAMIARLSEAL
jgi:hypothetical protein